MNNEFSMEYIIPILEHRFDTLLSYCCILSYVLSAQEIATLCARREIMSRSLQGINAATAATASGTIRGKVLSTSTLSQIFDLTQQSTI